MNKLGAVVLKPKALKLNILKIQTYL